MPSLKPSGEWRPHDLHTQNISAYFVHLQLFFIYWFTCLELLLFYLLLVYHDWFKKKKSFHLFYYIMTRLSKKVKIVLFLFHLFQSKRTFCVPESKWFRFECWVVLAQVVSSWSSGVQWFWPRCRVVPAQVSSSSHSNVEWFWLRYWAVLSKVLRSSGSNALWLWLRCWVVLAQILSSSGSNCWAVLAQVLRGSGSGVELCCPGCGVVGAQQFWLRWQAVQTDSNIELSGSLSLI